MCAHNRCGADIVLEAKAGPALCNQAGVDFTPWICRLDIIAAKFQMGLCFGLFSCDVLSNRNAMLCAAANKALRSTAVSLERGFGSGSLFEGALWFQRWSKVARKYAGADRFRGNFGGTQSDTYAPIQSRLSWLFPNLPQLHTSGKNNSRSLCDRIHKDYRRVDKTCAIAV